MFTPLDQAGLLGEREMAQTLLDAGAELRLPAVVGLQKTSEIVKLLRKDPDCLKPGQRWGTLIVRASEKAPGEVIEALLNAGASVSVRDDTKTAVDNTSGYTPLHAAAFGGNRSAVEVLLRHGANVRAREEKYQGTPAGWANYAGHPDVRDLILQGPIDIFEAISFGLTDRISEIVAREPEALNQPLSAYLFNPVTTVEWAPQGWQTPLAWAVSSGKEEAVRMLLELGAESKARTPSGLTLAALAGSQGNTAIQALLERLP